MKNFSKRTSKSFRCLAAHSSLQHSIIYHFRYIYILLFHCNFWAQPQLGPQAGQVFLVLTMTSTSAWRQNSIRRLTLGNRCLLVGSTWQQLSKAFRFFSTSIFLSIWLVKMSKLNLGNTYWHCAPCGLCSGNKTDGNSRNIQMQKREKWFKNARNIQMEKEESGLQKNRK